MCVCVCVYVCVCVCACVRARAHTCAASEVSQSVWWHYLVINIPDEVQFSDTGLLYLTGGGNHDGYGFMHIKHYTCI